MQDGECSEGGMREAEELMAMAVHSYCKGIWYEDGRRGNCHAGLDEKEGFVIPLLL